MKPPKDLFGRKGMRWLVRLFCRHDWRFHRNIYGDEINVTGGRSWWVCQKCAAMQVRPQLVKHVTEYEYYEED